MALIMLDLVIVYKFTDLTQKINPFQANVLFLYSQKLLKEKQIFPDVFSGYGKQT